MALLLHRRVVGWVPVVQETEAGAWSRHHPGSRNLHPSLVWGCLLRQTQQACWLVPRLVLRRRRLLPGKDRHRRFLRTAWGYREVRRPALVLQWARERASGLEQASLQGPVSVHLREEDNPLVPWSVPWCRAPRRWEWVPEMARGKASALACRSVCRLGRAPVLW